MGQSSLWPSVFQWLVHFMHKIHLKTYHLLWDRGHNEHEKRDLNELEAKLP